MSLHSRDTIRRMELINTLLNFILAIIHIFVGLFEYIINTIVGLINSIS